MSRHPMYAKQDRETIEDLKAKLAFMRESRDIWEKEAKIQQQHRTNAEERLARILSGFDITPSYGVFTDKMLYSVFTVRDGRQISCVGQFYTYEAAVAHVQRMAGKPHRFDARGNPVGNHDTPQEILK